MKATAVLGARSPLVSRAPRSAGLRVSQLRKTGVRLNAAAAPAPLSPLPAQQRGAAPPTDAAKLEQGAARVSIVGTNWTLKLISLAINLAFAVYCFSQGDGFGKFSAGVSMLSGLFCLILL